MTSEFSLFAEYMTALRELSTFSSDAPDFISRKAEHVVALKVHLQRLGYEPVWEDGEWKLQPTRKGATVEMQHVPEGTRILDAYVNALEEIASSNELHLVAKGAEHAIALLILMHQFGEKPVYHGSWWEMIPLNEEPKMF